MPTDQVRGLKAHGSSPANDRDGPIRTFGRNFLDILVPLSENDKGGCDQE